MVAYGPVGEKSKLVLRHSTAAVECYEGAVRSSKTITSLLDFLKFVRSGPEGDLALIGRTERTVYRNLIVPLQHMVGILRARYNQGNGILTILGRPVYIIGANNEESVSKIQGMTAAGIYIDEAASIPESFFNMATTRLSVPGAKMWLTCNPAGRNHWLKKNWLDKASLWIDRHGSLHINESDATMRVHRYTFTIDDNPFLSTEFVARLKASYTGVWYRRFILSEWTNAEGAVFDMFDPVKHVIPYNEIPKLERMYAIGIDYGTTNATAALKLGSAGNKLYLADEWRHDAKAGEPTWTDGQLSEGVRDFLGRGRPGDPVPEWLVVDPSAASFRHQLYIDGVGRVMEADNAVLDGIRTVSTLLGSGRLFISDSCSGLLDEMPEYAWDPKATEKGEDRPLKDHDHSIDGARYAIHSTRNLWRHIAKEVLNDAA
jgi:PBSX family phage terminase large subunit